jgi:hypothetical protein
MGRGRRRRHQKLPSLHSPFWAPDADAVISTATEAMTVAALGRAEEGLTTAAGRAGAGPQSLRPGRAGEPRQHPLAMLGLALMWDLRPQPLHHRLFRPAARRAGCSTGAGCVA